MVLPRWLWDNTPRPHRLSGGHLQHRTEMARPAALVPPSINMLQHPGYTWQAATLSQRLSHAGHRDRCPEQQRVRHFSSRKLPSRPASSAPALPDPVPMAIPPPGLLSVSPAATSHVLSARFFRFLGTQHRWDVHGWPRAVRAAGVLQGTVEGLPVLGAALASGLSIKPRPCFS